MAIGVPKKQKMGFEGFGKGGVRLAMRTQAETEVRRQNHNGSAPKVSRMRGDSQECGDEYGLGEAYQHFLGCGSLQLGNSHCDDSEPRSPRG